MNMTTSDGWTIAEIRRDSHTFNGDGVYAMVQSADGETLHLSRLEGETSWIADGLFGANGFPHWCHGFGSRCTLLKSVSDAELVKLLDQAAEQLAVTS